MERKLQAFSAAQPASRLAPLFTRSTTSRPPFVAPDRDATRTRTCRRYPAALVLERAGRQFSIVAGAAPKRCLAAALLFPLALRRGLAVDQ